MVDWAWVLTPLLVLPIVLLFRFIGCGEALSEDGDSQPVPRYRNYIMGELQDPNVPFPEVVPSKNDVIGYWRLVEADEAATEAADEKKFQNGQYKTNVSLAPVLPTATEAGSEAAPGTILTGQTSITMESPWTARFFNGGFVLVPFKAGLHTAEFTIEAWVREQWAQNVTGYDHVLFHAGGHYRPFGTTGSATYRGFTVVATRDNRWQVIVYPGGKAFLAGPLVPQNVNFHIALTVQNDGLKKKVSLFLNGQIGAIAIVNSYNLPEGAPLFIGIDNLAQDPAAALDLRYPVLSTIQEVVLHKKALSRQEILNHVEFK